MYLLTSYNTSLLYSSVHATPSFYLVLFLSSHHSHRPWSFKSRRPSLVFSFFSFSFFAFLSPPFSN
ncbi:hypothetical protein F4810DRAFT_677330 [Camillea tinctor]|nr:hypothetical protein F4810DRAFT_677330 [Camillea tinctor]